MSKITLELGSGGRMMRDFLADTILPLLGNRYLEDLPDAGRLPGGIVFTTDGYVVDPPFFPGGDIGTLCVNGTVNDLVVSGASPRYLSLSLILEEGLAVEDLHRILKSIGKASREAGVAVVTGDTKVVRKGQGDKIFIVTSGIGTSVAQPAPARIRKGDKIILTGTLGEHSLAVMTARGEFGLTTRVRSDCAPLVFLLPFWKKGILWMRDVTRGGLATILSELADALPYPVLIREDRIPLSHAVRGASELLGIDPLFMACEGRAVLVVPKKKADGILEQIRRHPLGKKAAIIGEIGRPAEGRPGELLLETSTGGLRLLEALTSELLPRIC